ncbi:hypothetical protein PIB30_048912 [Stylosanthes scabra]|uniref:Uncharacterized protein n=1 Tax=Stylosanthes scabra TaxID=79078 RepID=A0ABU6UK09_9FABA|nr:hypothetical protein [Stylosanthes scabra]
MARRKSRMSIELGVQRDGPLVSYRTRSGWPYSRSNELISRRDRHASCAFV